jgi:UDP-GlcNAc:undecaprenyl-phosphate GlcNAc-1-phosphate transferase
MEGWYLIVYSSAALVSICSLLYMKERIIAFLQNKHLTKRNYAGCNVATGGGIMLLFPCTAGIIPFLFMAFEYRQVFYMLCVFAPALAGFADDIAGDGASKGFAGHGRSILEGEFTTGQLKAYTGVILGLLAALIKMDGIFESLINVLIFALSVNFMNLLDLRPGRTIKGFLIVVLAVFLASGMESLWIITPLISAIPFYIGGELREEYMLGDTGSNLIGGILGLYTVFSLSFTGKIIFFIILAVIHAASEKISLTKLIDSIPLLRKIDEAGRKKR